MRRILVERVRLGPSRPPTGRTRHYYGSISEDGRVVKDREVPVPAELQIVYYPGYQGYYLLYLDEQGNELTDTWHATLEDAMAQADFEFEVKSDDWELLKEPLGEE